LFVALFIALTVTDIAVPDPSPASNNTIPEPSPVPDVPSPASNNTIPTYNFPDLYVCPSSSSGDSQKILTGCAIAIIIIGIAMIFAGYKTIRGIAFVVGFCVLFVVAYIVIDHYIHPDWNMSIKLGVSAGIGVIGGGLLAYFVEHLPFLIGFGIGLLVTSLVMATPIGPQAIRPGNWLPLACLALGGLAGGVIGYFLRNFVLMLVSAFLGSLFIAYSVDCAWLKTDFTMVIPNIIAMHPLSFKSEQNIISYCLIGGVLLFTIVGFLFQCYRKSKEEENGRHHQYQELSP